MLSFHKMRENHPHQRKYSGLQRSVPTVAEVSYNLHGVVSVLDSAYEVIQTNHCLKLDVIVQE